MSQLTSLEDLRDLSGYKKDLKGERVTLKIGRCRRNKRDEIEVFKGLDPAKIRIALKSAGRIPDMFFGAREGVIEAAFHGIDCAIVIVDEEFTDFLKRLESVELAYVIHDLIAP